MKILLVPALAMMAFTAPMSAAYADDPDSPEFWAILEGKPYAGAPDTPTVSQPVIVHHKPAHRIFLAQHGHHVRHPVQEPTTSVE